MKTRSLCFLLAGVLWAPALRAQERPVKEKDVPPAVLSAFHKTYPSAKIRGITTEVEKGKKYYEIESVEGEQSRDILYLPNGTAAEVEEAMSPGSLSSTVRDAVAHLFPGAEIAKAERVTGGAETSFEIHVRHGAQRGSVVLNAAGKVLEKHALRTPGTKERSGKGKSGEEEEDD